MKLLRLLAERFGLATPAAVELPAADRTAASGPCSCGPEGHIQALRDIIAAHYPDVVVGEPLVVVGEVLDNGERSVVVCNSYASGQERDRMVRLNDVQYELDEQLSQRNYRIGELEHQLYEEKRRREQVEYELEDERRKTSDLERQLRDASRGSIW